MECKLRSSKTVFVGGPIQHAVSLHQSDGSLRELITLILSELEKGGYEIFSAHRAEAFGLESGKFSSCEIAIRDFDWMHRCQSFVAILPAGHDGHAFRTDGTHIELGWASALGKPILAVAPLPLTEGYCHLIRGLQAVTHVDFVDIHEVRKRPAVLLKVIERHFLEKRNPRVASL